MKQKRSWLGGHIWAKRPYSSIGFQMTSLSRSLFRLYCLADKSKPLLLSTYHFQTPMHSITVQTLSHLIYFIKLPQELGMLSPMYVGTK